MAHVPNVRLQTPGRAENVILAREALSGLAQAVRLDGVALGDIRTAVTEAANNAIMHGYAAAAEGPLEVEATMLGLEVDVVVRDLGRGITPEEARSEEGIGLAVIRALSTRLDVRGSNDAGTEVRMWLPAVLDGAPPAPAPEDERPSGLAPLAGAGDTLLEVAPAGLLAFVLPRLLGVLAAQARFSTDRISDTALLADALVAHASRSHDGARLGALVRIPAARRMTVVLGPLRADTTAQALDGARIEGLGAAVRGLGDAFTLHPLQSGGEAIEVRITDPGPPGREDGTGLSTAAPA